MIVLIGWSLQCTVSWTKLEALQNAALVSICVFIFVYLCICVFVYLCICVFVYLFICVFVYLYLRGCHHHWVEPGGVSSTKLEPLQNAPDSLRPSGGAMN